MDRGEEIIKSVMKSHARRIYLSGRLPIQNIIKTLELAKNERDDLMYAINTYGENDSLRRELEDIKIEIDALRFYYKLNMN